MVVEGSRLDRLKRITKTNKFRLFACAMGGIVSSIPYFYPSFFILSWFSYALCFYFIIEYAKDGKQACLYLFSTELARNIFTFMWFRELSSMTVFDMPRIFISLIIFIAIFGISLFQSAVLCISATPIRAAFSYCKSDTVSLICSALFYSILEMILGTGPLGFPWSAIYISQQSFLPAIQSASLFGAHFVSFLVILANLCIAVAFKRHHEGAKSRGVCIFIASLLLLNTLFGIYQIGTEGKSVGEIKVAAIQDNTSSYDKWGGGTREIFGRVEEELKFTKDADLVLCSETVFPVTLDTNIAKASPIAKEIELNLCNYSYDNESVVVAGAFSKSGSNNYNSLFLFDNGLIYPDTYDKKNIVPFGEYLPMEEFILKVFPFIDNMNLSGNTLSAGKSSPVFTSSIGKLGCMICFDSIFFANARESVQNGAQIILLSTNDSWYNDSAATLQHLGHSVFRAIENKRYLVRSATTGYSAIIDEDGRIIQKSKLLTQTNINGKARLYDETTLFNRYGYIPLIMAASGAFLFLAICRIENIIREKDESDRDELL